MKKNMKIRITAEGIRAILNLFKEAHNLNNYAERYEDSCCNGCYPPDGDDWDDWESWCRDCSCKDMPMPCNIMVQLLDYNKKHITSNWLNNSSYPCNYWWDGNENCLASTLSDYYDIDLHHITWGAGNEALAKARYIRIFVRTETDTGDEMAVINRGYELDIYGKKYYPFIRTVYDYYGHGIVHDYVY